MLAELIEMYMTDKNSSTLREIVTVRVAGYKHSEEKLGYNGFKEEQGRKKMCEVKPVNVNEGERKKLNGGGNFTDYRWSRFERDSEENPNMLVSGFVSGKLIYILEFPFNCPSFKERIEEQLRSGFLMETHPEDMQGLWSSIIKTIKIVQKRFL